MKPEYIEALDPAREPSSKDTQALVNAAVVAVDHFDNSIPQGTFPTGVNFLYVIGRDMVGTVEVVGAKVRRI